MEFEWITHHPLDVGVPEHLAAHSAVPTADDEHSLGRRQQIQWDMGEHLVV